MTRGYMGTTPDGGIDDADREPQSLPSADAASLPVAQIMHAMANDGKCHPVAWFTSPGSLPDGTPLYAGSKPSSSIAAIYVHCGEMVESNGRRTWIVSLSHSPDAEPWDCLQVYDDHIEGRARYEADRLKHFFGLGPEPDILAYDVNPKPQSATKASDQ